LASYAIPLAALIVSAASFVGATLLSARSYARSASSAWVGELESRIDHLQEDLAECRADRQRLHARCEDLHESEVRLMRRVMALEAAETP
jgi:hypothetical protein